MKKLLIATILALTALSSFAQQQVPIHWPFALSGTIVSTMRLTIAEANRQQNKYVFYFDVKQGAGGAIAANATLNHNGPALLYTSSSFFVRPIFYPNESHDISMFAPVTIECAEQPWVIVSSKYKSLAELRQQKRVTIGANFGSLTEVIAKELQSKLPNTEVSIIGYKDIITPTLDVIAGNLDLNVDMTSSSLQWIEKSKLHTIGTTGTKDYKHFPSMKSQGMTGFDGLIGSFFVVAKASDKDFAREAHEILTKASRNVPELGPMFNSDYCVRPDYDYKKTVDHYAQWNRYWPGALKKYIK
jgi:tripartite-type tricarboxylate transporter receptor subunit TctC